MLRRDNGDVRAEVAVIADGHLGVILNGQVKIAEEALADARVHAVMDGDRALNEPAFAEGAQHLLKDLSALFGFILIGPVVIDVQIVRAQLDGA